MSQLIFEITDQREIESLRDLSKKVVEKPWSLSLDFIKDRNMMVMPKEKGRHFEENEAVLVSSALMNIYGNVESIAIATENLSFGSCYRVIATKKGLMDFSEVNAGINFLLCNKEFTFIILLTSESYNLYCGTKNFIELATGASIDKGRERFKEFANEDFWEGSMLKVYQRYCNVQE